MEQIIEVPLNKITQDQGIYPRFHTDIKRIDLFTELLNCGTSFPPIKVVRENGYYILLDGTHRLEMYKKTDRKSIKAQVWDIPKHHRRLAAARFNNNSSQPLKAEELQKAIRDAYEIDEIKDTAEIAHEIGCSDRYIRRVLKPLKDRAREEVENRVKRLRDEGVSQREVAKEVEITRDIVRNIEKKNNVGENGTVPFSPTPTKIENNIAETPAEIKEITEIKNIEDVQAVRVEKKVEPAIPDSPDSLGGRELEQWEKEILKTLVLVKAGWDVNEIAKEFYRSSKVWVRNSSMVLLALYWNDGEQSMDEMKDFLDKVPGEHVDFINSLLGFPEIIPGRGTTFAWLKNNQPPYKDAVYDRVLFRENMFCVRQGKKSFDEDEEKIDVQERPFEALPQDVINGFKQGIDLFEKLTEMVKQGRFHDKEVRRDLITEYNRFMVALNAFKDTVQRIY
ncbi:MAG: hypothetical protein JRD43_08915 [Deltaproteobacteria bacterium]|nr:hypothetical protein [Deltaproteobacteria bacterium]